MNFRPRRLLLAASFLAVAASAHGAQPSVLWGERGEKNTTRPGCCRTSPSPVNLTCIVEASRDLTGWTIPVSLIGTTPLDPEFDLATYAPTPAVSTEPRLFFRLRVF